MNFLMKGYPEPFWLKERVPQAEKTFGTWGNRGEEAWRRGKRIKL